MSEERTSSRRAGGERRIWNTAIKVRIHPTEAQAALCEKTFGCCRYLWNQMLADEQAFYAAADVHFLPAPARYKAGAPFLKEAVSQALVDVHQNLRQAFRRFFSQPEIYGYPQFRRKKSGRDSFKIPCQYYKSGSGSDIFLTRDGIRLPKLGIVKARFHRRPLHWWKLKSATVSRTPAGKYYCSLLYAYEAAEKPAPAPEKTLDLRLSPLHFYEDIQGGRPDPPPWMGRSREKLAEMQRRLARMERGSRSYQDQLQKIRLQHEHIANQRRDFVHKESRRIANAWDAVRVEDACLRRAGNGAETGFGMFRDCLRYKLERQGKRYVPWGDTRSGRGAG
jgi:putative transposase